MKEIKSREECKKEIIDLIIEDLQEDEKGQLTASYVIRLLEELAHDIEAKAISLGIQKIMQ